MTTLPISDYLIKVSSKLGLYMPEICYLPVQIFVKIQFLYCNCYQKWIQYYWPCLHSWSKCTQSPVTISFKLQRLFGSGQVLHIVLFLF